MLFCFFYQSHTNLDSLNKTCPLMIPAELADRVYDFVHLPERHSIHLLVELVEIRTNLLVVIGIVFVVTFVEHSQNGLSIAKVWWMLCNTKV